MPLQNAPIKDYARLSRERGERVFPRKLLDDDRTYPSERSIFADEDTGVEIWRLTSLPSTDHTAYSSVPAYSPDGRRIVFLSTRKHGDWEPSGSGHFRYAARTIMAMATDGTGLTELGVDGNYPVFSHDGEEIFFGQDEALMALLLETGERRAVVVHDDARDAYIWQLNVSSDGRHVCYVLHYAADAGIPIRIPSEIWVARVDGSAKTQIASGHVGHPQFCPADSTQLSFVDFELDHSLWLIGIDGTNARPFAAASESPAVSDRFCDEGYRRAWTARLGPSLKQCLWWPGSRDRCSAVHDGVIVLVDGSSGSCEQLGHFAGHPVADADGRSVATDSGGRLTMFHVNAALSGHPFAEKLCGARHRSLLDRTRGFHNHMHPCWSPDGTKILFSSNSHWDDKHLMDLFAAVVRNPMPPRNLRLERDGEQTALKWDPPVRSREIAGYCLYRSDMSASGYERVARSLTPKEGRILQNLPRRPTYYVVTAVEHSGLESGYSNEVCVRVGSDDAPPRPIRVFCEAEHGLLSPAMVAVRGAGASNRECVRPAQDDLPARVDIEFTLERLSSYVIWARVRCSGAKSAWRVTLPNGRRAELKVLNKPWQWLRLAGEGQFLFPLQAGRHRLSFESVGGIPYLDRICITDDMELRPIAEGTERSAPAKVARARTSIVDNVIVLEWDESPQALHYNVYSSVLSDFSCDPATLLVSPCDTRHVDWYVQPGQTYYYRVAAINAAGLESEPSSTISCRL